VQVVSSVAINKVRWRLPIYILLAGTEALHNGITLRLWHLTVHGGDGEVGLLHGIGEPIDLSSSVAEDDGLSDGESIVQVAKRIELPLLLLDSDKELFDAFESKLITLDQNADRIGHELGSHFKNLVWQSGGNQQHLQHMCQLRLTRARALSLSLARALCLNLLQIDRHT
jgi:hypothetical protein